MMLPLPLSGGGIGPTTGLPLSSPGDSKGSIEFGDAMRLAEKKSPAFSAAKDAVGSDDLLGPVGKYVNEVNRLQLDSESQQNALASGQDIDLHDVMISSEKAAVSLQLTLAMRNKLLEAYQEVMRMQV